jgi:hypothetical protein
MAFTTIDEPTLYSQGFAIVGASSGSTTGINTSTRTASVENEKERRTANKSENKNFGALLTSTAVLAMHSLPAK